MTFSLFIFLVITILYPFLRFKLSSPSNNTTIDFPKIVGHRGAAGLAPENTLASFKRALDLKVDYIELDLHVSADGELIVIHDSNVKRTTDGEGEIADMTLQQIKQLDAGSWFGPEFGSEKVPTFEEVLDLVNGQCKILVELKWSKKGAYPSLVDKLLQLIQDRGVSDQLIIQSFERSYLEEITTSNNPVEIQQLIFGKSSILPIYFDTQLRFGSFEPVAGITSLNMFYLYLNKGWVNTNEQLGFGTGVFTINDENDMKKAATFGADLIITDFPDKAIKILR
ncbi:glycerophosphodiester phosphodiesterase [Flagellimonas myxillae]|uniref:glycerophosphodiester phosphodiesterase n=1 Tax=Flagellimonas myxillae TaxID=2942214 RepID=UPI00201EDE43|nr:glycerophosphodiester phosphodiesterase family protein [Muricauda myxillae]MCL6266434.1 hypothetical protein [Muricauda myxillae]